MEKWKTKLLMLVGIIPLLIGIVMIVSVVNMDEEASRKETDHKVEVRKTPNEDGDIGDKRVSVGGLYNYNPDDKYSNSDESSNGSDKEGKGGTEGSYSASNKESNSVDNVKVSKGNGFNIVSGETSDGKNSIKIAVPNSNYSLNTNKPSTNEKPKKINKVDQLPDRLNPTASKVKPIYDKYGYKVIANKDGIGFAAIKNRRMQNFYKSSDSGKYTYNIDRGSSDAEYRMAAKVIVTLGAKVKEDELYNAIKKSLTSGGEEIYIGNIMVGSDGRVTQIRW